jgi:hypothetical protein
MFNRILEGLIAAAALTVAGASPALAQIRVEVAATVGYYSPMGSFRPDFPASSDLPRSPSDLAGSALGGELRVWVAPRLGISLGGSTVATSVGGGSTPNGVRQSVPARVSMGSAQLLFRISGEASRTRIWLSGGGGVIQHGGKAYSVFDKPVNYGGVVGVGSAFRLRRGLSIDAGLSSMIYKVDFRNSPTADDRLRERGTQADMTLHTGLSYSWN